jgi:hypothetical protein
MGGKAFSGKRITLSEDGLWRVDDGETNHSLHTKMTDIHGRVDLILLCRFGKRREGERPVYELRGCNWDTSNTDAHNLEWSAIS